MSYDDPGPRRRAPAPTRPARRSAGPRRGAPRRTAPKAPAGRRPPPPEQRQRRTKKRLPPKLFFGLAGGMLVLVVLAVVAVVALSGEDKAVAKPTVPMGRPADSGSSPSSYSNSPSTDAYTAIDRRTADPSPLTVDEAFPSSTRTLTAAEAKSKLTLRDQRTDNDCARAIWGGAVGNEVRKGACNQAIRGIYSDQKKGFALSVTILNLAGVEDANRVVDAFGRGRGGGFVQPLPAVKGFGQGFSMARGLAMGHYVVIAWAQRLDGDGDEQDEALLSLLIEGSKAPAVLGRAAGAQ